MLQEELDKKVLTYINDIFTIEKTRKEHQERIRKTLRKLLKTELRIKFFKNEFKKKKVKFLRHIIGNEDIKPDLEKIRVLRE